MQSVIKFKTIFKEKIWGGQKIKTVLGKDYGDLDNCGETWELSGVPGNVSEVAEGELAGQTLHQLIEAFGADLLGSSVMEKYGTEFPLLVKFIDARRDLSIQVHPNDQLAKKRHNSFGKSEMWYILEADHGASLISGFNQPLDKQKYLEKFEAGQLTDVLNRELVMAGDVFYLPAGRVHTIGAGILLAEIQQSSDVTYRIYDFDRPDKNGALRELHTEQALDAIQFECLESYKTPYNDGQGSATPILATPYFETNKFLIDEPIVRDFSGIESFKIFICYRGEAELEFASERAKMQKGDVLLIPAAVKAISILPRGETEFLETYIP